MKKRLEPRLQIEYDESGQGKMKLFSSIIKFMNVKILLDTGTIITYNSHTLWDPKYVLNMDKSAYSEA